MLEADEKHKEALVKEDNHEVAMSFKAPQEFDFSMPGNWPAWRDRWQRFKLAAKLHKETQEVQVSALCCICWRQP